MLPGAAQFCSKILYVPKQDYSSRLMIVESAIRNTGVQSVPPQLVQTLSHVAKFYAPGPLVTAIKATITARRLARLVRKPLQVDEFISALCKLDPVRPSSRGSLFCQHGQPDRVHFPPQVFGAVEEELQVWGWKAHGALFPPPPEEGDGAAEPKKKEGKKKK